MTCSEMRALQMLREGFGIEDAKVKWGLSYAKIANTIRILGATDLEPHARIAAKRAARPAPRLTA